MMDRRGGLGSAFAEAMADYWGSNSQTYRFPRQSVALCKYEQLFLKRKREKGFEVLDGGLVRRINR